MHMLVIHLFLTFSLEIARGAIPYIQDFLLLPTGTGNGNNATTFNKTCDECLCQAFGANASTEYLALNCFANQTCQLFTSFPISYKMQDSVGAQLYFLQGSFPSPSQGCMPNITELIDRLKNATPIVVPLSFTPSTFGYDEANPNEAVVIAGYAGDLYWFNPIDMSFLRSQTISFRETIAIHNNTILTGIDGDPNVHVLDKQTLAPLANITYPSLIQVRKFLFLNNGQTIVVPTQSNHSITFINVQSTTQCIVQVRGILLLRYVISMSLESDCFRANFLAH